VFALSLRFFWCSCITIGDPREDLISDSNCDIQSRSSVFSLLFSSKEVNVVSLVVVAKLLICKINVSFSHIGVDSPSVSIVVCTKNNIVVFA